VAFDDKMRLFVAFGNQVDVFQLSDLFLSADTQFTLPEPIYTLQHPAPRYLPPESATTEPLVPSVINAIRIDRLFNNQVCVVTVDDGGMTMYIQHVDILFL